MALDHGIGVRIPASQPDFARRFAASFVQAGETFAVRASYRQPSLERAELRPGRRVWSVPSFARAGESGASEHSLSAKRVTRRRRLSRRSWLMIHASEGGPSEPCGICGAAVTAR